MKNSTLFKRRATSDAYENMERMLRRVLAGEDEVPLSGTCMDVHGLSEAEMMEGVRGTMDELAAATIAANKVLVF